MSDYKGRFVDNPCRLVIAGMNSLGNKIQIMGMGGRSEGSQSRRYFFGDDGTLRAVPLDLATPPDPLRHYAAMQVSGNVHVAGNGDQTDTIMQSLKDKPPARAFREALDTRYCEPDAPLFTPRITTMTTIDTTQTCFSLLTPKKLDKKAWKLGVKDHLNAQQFPTTRTYTRFDEKRGQGHCLTTYEPGQIETLPSFRGDPFPVPLEGDIERILNYYMYDILDPRVTALAGKEISPDGIYSIVSLRRGEEPVLQFSSIFV